MKATIINETNRAKIETAIAETEGRATVRCVGFDTVKKVCKHIEEVLAVPKKYLEGVKFSVDPHAQNFPKAYKYTPESTQFVVEFSKGKWRVSGFRRAKTRTPNNRYICIEMPEETKHAIIREKIVFW